MTNTSYLILGGARSGKSRRAQQLAESLASDLVYIATAEAGDDEMAARIEQHIADRGPAWATVEAPIGLCEAIVRTCKPNVVAVVDCLTLWLSNVLLADGDVDSEVDKLVAVISDVESGLIMVSNEVGLGLVPDNELGRRFRDAQGRLNQRIAATCDHVELIAAGLPIRLKG